MPRILSCYFTSIEGHDSAARYESLKLPWPCWDEVTVRWGNEDRSCSQELQVARALINQSVWAWSNSAYCSRTFCYLCATRVLDYASEQSAVTRCFLDLHKFFLTVHLYMPMHTDVIVTCPRNPTFDIFRMQYIHTLSLSNSCLKQVCMCIPRENPSKTSMFQTWGGKLSLKLWTFMHHTLINIKPLLILDSCSRLRSYVVHISYMLLRSILLARIPLAQPYLLRNQNAENETVGRKFWHQYQCINRWTKQKGWR